jgi:hypothetical protein
MAQLLAALPRACYWVANKLPGSLSVTSTRITIGPVKRDGNKWVMDARLAMIDGAGFAGPMRLEVEATARGTISRSIWGPGAEGVRSAPLPAVAGGYAHISTENSLANPERPFSGYAGLIEYLR